MSVILRIFLPLALLSTLYQPDTSPTPIKAPAATTEESQPPFTCQGFYATYSGTQGNWATYNFDGTYNNIGSVGAGINGSGYNTIDNFIYTYRGNGHLLRLHDDGTFDDLGDTNIPGGLTAGAFDTNGNFYVSSGNNNTCFRVDVTTNTFSTITMSGAFNGKDWAYRVTDQIFYGVQNSILYGFNPATNAVTTATLTGLSPGETTFGAAWYAADDFIYVLSNATGRMYKIDVNTAQATFVLVADTNGTTDGVSCPTAMPPFPVVCAFDDEACANAVGPTTFEITNNDIAHLTSLDGGTLIIVDPPNLGTVSFNPFTGEITYTYTGAPGPDEFIYRICGTSSNPTVCDVATVTIDPAPSLTFPLYGPYCQGELPPTLPTTSFEGTTGSWSPATIDTDSPGFTEYIFTPDATGDCVFPYSQFVIVNPTINPQFNLQNSFCSGDIIPALPTTSDNNIAGTWMPAVIDPNNSGSYVFTPQGIICGATYTLDVTIQPSGTSTFSLTDNYCAGATTDVLPATDDNGITGSWSPATIDNQNSGAYVFTPDAGQCGGNFTLNVMIDQPTIPVFSFNTQYCEGATVDALPTTSDNGVTGTWSPAIIDNQSSGSYTFTPSGSLCASPVTIDVTINPNINPAFSFTTTYCAGFMPDVLPTTSDNGVMGSWSPATIDNQNSGTYVFTPALGECASSVNIDVTINSSLPTDFALTTNYCQGATVELLPTTDINGFTGAWAPATIDNQNSGTYVFTPDGAQCVAPFTLNVTIDAPSLPSFSFATNYCAGSTPDALPATSDNGITGSWSAANIDNQNNGNYVFTPDANQCATTASIDVTIDQPLDPSFSFTTTYCAGDAVDALPTTSDNGVTGSWSAAIIDNQNNGSYIFTPTIGICANPQTINVQIDPVPTISFSLPSQLCEGAAAPTLPLTDQNGITGSWSPAAIDNMNDGSYIFTPDADPCAPPFTLNINVVQPSQPVFSVTTNYCAGNTVDLLPATSDNGVVGSWSPVAIDNQNSNTYTFTPDAAGCADPLVLNVTIDQPQTPTFNLTTTYCAGSAVDALPPTSDNGVNGSWSPATIDNQNSGTYTFTPNTGICANSFTLNVQIDPVPLISFNLPDQICLDATAPILPSSDQNGVTGSWSPALVDNQASASYTFIPDAGQCASPIVQNITVNTPPVLDLQIGNAINCNGGTGSLNLGITGAGGYTFTWSDASLNGQQNPTGLTPDNYAVTVMDANGCSSMTSIMLTEPTPLSLDCSDTINPSVILAMDGAVNLVFGGGTPSYTISWSGQQSGMTTTSGTSFTITGLGAGNYNVVLTDANGCMIDCDFELENPDCDLAVMASPSNPNCSNFTDGSIDLTITGTLPAASIDWNDDSLDGQEDPTGLGIGTYTVTITDIANCTAEATITLTAPDPVASIFNLVNDFCAGDAVPNLPTTSDNGITGSWSPTNIDNQNSGTYTFTPNATECADPFTLNVSVSPIVTPQFSITNLYCQSSNVDGLPSVSQNGITGSWSPAVIDNQNSGTYTFTPDGGQCAEVFTLAVTIDPLVTPAFSFNLDYCQNEAVPSLPTTSDNGISGSWSPSTIDNQNSSIYTFTPSGDQCAVVSQVSVSINLPPTLLLRQSRAVSCTGATDAALELTVTGNGPYDFDWSDNNLDGQQNPAGLGASSYSVTVTDINGCSSVASANISEPTSLTLNCTVSLDPSRPELADGSANISIGGGSNGYQVSWTGPVNGNIALSEAGNFPIQNLPEGTYDILLADANGCTSSCSFTLAAPQGCNLMANPTGIAAICGTNIGSIFLDGIDGGDGFYEYSLDGDTYNLVGDFPFSIAVTANERYTIWLQDGDGCPSSWDVFVPAAREYILDLGMDQTIRLGDSIRINPQLNFFPVGAIWSDSTSISAIDGLNVYARPTQTTEYTLTMVDSLGCTATDNIRIIVDRQDAVFVPSAFSPNNDGINDALTIFTDNSVVGVNRFLVFDRWGEPVFENYDFLPNDPSEGWNGLHRNEKANTGVYIYLVEVTKADGAQVLFKGDVSLLR